MTQKLGYVALLVRDYDEGIAFFTNKLEFQLIEDTDLGDGKRWVRVRPTGSTGTDLAACPRSEPRAVQPHRQPNRRPRLLFLYTDDFWRDYHTFAARGVKFCRPPSEESYGRVAVFEDLYGNKWDLLQLKADS